jgi:hypothetical protein
VQVFPPCRILSFTVDKTTAAFGESVNFTWATESCASVRLAGIPVSNTGSQAMVPVPGSRAYILDALGPGNDDSRELVVTAATP